MCSSDLFGTAVTGGEDVDGDGLGDLVACSLETAGGVFLFTGGTALTTTTEAAASIHLTDDEDGGYGMFGQSVAFGEVDGDGAVDLMVADNDPRANFYAFPNAVLRAGGVTGSEAASRFYQPRDTYEFGAGKLRMGGDLDADGMEELVIAYPSWGPYGEPAGYGAAVVVGGADLRAE